MKRASISMTTSLLALLLACQPTLAQNASTAPPPLTFDYKTQIAVAPRPATVLLGFTFAAAGDLIYSLPILPRKDAGVEAIAKLVRGADAALANQEGSILDLESFKGYLEAQTGGGYPVGRPELAQDIAGLGFDFANKANNHSADFGVQGLIESRRHLEEAGLKVPGAGVNRALARAPQYFDTPHGRVAVVGVASTFVGSAPAGAAGGGAPGRPGISVIRTKRIAIVPEAEMVALRALAASYSRKVAPDARQVTLGEQTFRVGPAAGFVYEMNDVDRFEILRAVRGAKNVADLAVFTIHAHENAGLGDDRVPADFQQALYHDVIDTGADVVAVHGPHITRGVEIYKGRPIFYGLGHSVAHFIGTAPMTPEMFENGATDSRFVAPGDADGDPAPRAWYDGLIAITEYGAQGAIREIRLYPLDLRPDEPMNKRGIPRPATGARAQAILAQVQKDSEAYGTRIAIEGDLGVIRPGR